ncbi:MAG: coproporphyrinogen dehydrogenase HemZ [Firmicutes bacterium]|nr:coproporphyrinogen dehydrogenase HemZ [Bacillota bacterium]
MELIDEFLPKSAYELADEFADHTGENDTLISVNKEGCSDINAIKRELYNTLSKYVEETPDWGILTGVRPVKLAGELIEKNGRSIAEKILKTDYFISDEKTKLALDIYEDQIASCGYPEEESVSLYIGIPFCPTRCSYCAFASNQEDYGEVKKYLDALYREIDYVAEEMREAALYPESIYIGGGTPTTLTSEDMTILLKRIADSFDLAKVKEYTVEAGRPDTIDGEKLLAIKECGADRISINPQSMKADTMKLIGRAHEPGDIERAFTEAREMGFKSINMDLIAGLPEETLTDFRDSLKRILEMEPENITVHSLAVKRASRLKEEDPDLYVKQSEEVRKMVKTALSELSEAGYKPYYLYRQKHMAGACENMGYAKPGTEGLYNIRIMDEHQTNIALGAGGISKIYYPNENRLERVANVTNYREYINRIDEMIERKREGVFNAY